MNVLNYFILATVYILFIDLPPESIIKIDMEVLVIKSWMLISLRVSSSWWFLKQAPTV